MSRKEIPLLSSQESYIEVHGIPMQGSNLFNICTLNLCKENLGTALPHRTFLAVFDGIYQFFTFRRQLS